MNLAAHLHVPGPSTILAYSRLADGQFSSRSYRSAQIPLGILPGGTYIPLPVIRPLGLQHDGRYP